MAAAAAILNYFSTFWQLFGDRRKIAKSTFFQHFGDSPGDPSEGLFRNFSVTFGRFVGIGPVAGEAHHKRAVGVVVVVAAEAVAVADRPRREGGRQHCDAPRPLQGRFRRNA